MGELKRIYVVEDDDLVAETLALILEQSGYGVALYGDAESAFEAISQAKPDFIMSNVLLAGKDVPCHLYR